VLVLLPLQSLAKENIMALFDINKYIEEQGSEEPVSSIMRPNTQAEEPDTMMDFYKRFSKGIYDAFPDKEKFKETFVKQRKTGINWDEVRRYTREADMQDAIQSSIEQALGIIPQQQEEEPEQTQGLTLVDVTDTDEGRLSNEAPLQELMSDITEEKITKEELPAIETGEGLMRRPVTPEQREAILEMSDITKSQQTSISDSDGFSKTKLSEAVGKSVGSTKKKAAIAGMIDIEVGNDGPVTETSYSLSNLSDFTGAWRRRSIEAGLLDQNGRPTQRARDLNRQGLLGDAIFDVQYAGRNGNGDIESGDGSTFKGRGLVQITGRGNYQAVQNILQAQGVDIDLINNPELVNDERYALPAALAYLEHAGFTDEAAETMSARSLQLAINPQAPAATAEERWDAAMTSLRAEDSDIADEMENRNEYAAQRTVGTSVDGIIGRNSRAAMRSWLEENNVSIPANATDMDLVVLVNENS
jgi:predicted chitinase